MENQGYLMAKKKTSLSVEESTVELGMLAESLGYHLRRAQLNNYRRFAATLGRTGITPAQLTVLLLVEINPGISQTELGGILGMDRATTMTLIDKLQIREWLQRRKSAQDRRKHALHLTAKGERALRKMKAEIDVVEKDFTAALSRDERKQLLFLLQKLI